MGIMDMFVEKYPVKKKCRNCKKETVIGIPKGKTIEEYMDTNQMKCKFCGCTIEKGDE